VSEPRFLSPATLPSPFGYSQVVDVPAGRTIYISGQIPFDVDGQLVGEGDLEVQTRQVFANLTAALGAAGASWSDVVKLNFFVRDVTQVPGVVRPVRDEYLNTAQPPASTLVEVSRLFREDVLIEIDAVASRAV
jgi:reactive intermediate/imine deaminase